MRTPMNRSARGLLCLLSVVVCGPLAAPACGQSQMTDLASRVGITIAAEGRSGSRLRDTRVKQLPWKKIAVENQKRIREVLDECAQYRQLPELHYEVHPEVYRYLVEHPDVAVSTWRVMGISRVEMWQTGAMEYEATAPDGSLGLADVLYRDESQCLLLCEGTYSNPLLPRPITASGLVWLRYNYRPGKDGKTQVRQRLDVFVSFPSTAARAMALLVSPITNVMMDRNAFEVSLYARMMSQAARNDPAWLMQVADQMEGVLPQRHRELKSLVRSVETARDRTTTVSGRTPRRRTPMSTFRASMIDVHRTVTVPVSAPNSARSSADQKGRRGGRQAREQSRQSKTRPGLTVTGPMSSASRPDASSVSMSQTHGDDRNSKSSVSETSRPGVATTLR